MTFSAKYIANSTLHIGFTITKTLH